MENGARVSGGHGDDASEAAEQMTSVFRADFLPTEPPLTASGEGPLPTPGSVVLVITRGPNAGTRVVLDKATVTAGRHPGADVFLDDVSVSRRHAEFQITADGEVRVNDVNSLNGTYVNRQPVDSATLTHGDEVQIGRFRMVFLTGDPRLSGG